jgi:DNA-binding NarL/FixJ family response regulator
MSAQIRDDNHVRRKPGRADGDQLRADDSIKVLLIDDQTVVRAGLRILIESKAGVVVVGEAGNSSDAVSMAQSERPDIVLLDLTIGGESGLDYIPRLLAVSIQSRILILTDLDDPEMHLRAVERGAMGLVLKNHTRDTLIKAIQRVHSGETWLTPPQVSEVGPTVLVMPDMGKTDAETDQLNILSRRERGIIACVCEGLRNKQIADRLSISDAVVRQVLSSIFNKLDVADRFELVIYAYVHGLAALRPADESNKY